MAVLPLLADPQRYRPCDTDLLANGKALAYWLDLLESHFQTQLDAAASVGFDVAAISCAKSTFANDLRLIREEPDRDGRLDLLGLLRLRQEALRSAGIEDEFRLIKSRENEAAMDALPGRLEFLDASDGQDLLENLVRGILAGNMFDLGAVEVAGRFMEGPTPFAEFLAAVPDRPWRFDDMDRAAAHFAQTAVRKAVIFVDNAGADVVLGALPLARFFVNGNAEVVLAANRMPTLNDVTIEELRGLLERAGTMDEALASRRIGTVDSGCDLALIDMASVSSELALAGQGADMVVLIGMGRAVESNWSTLFTCPCMRIAMIKDKQVAENVGASLYDAVVRFDVPSRP